MKNLPEPATGVVATICLAALIGCISAPVMTTAAPLQPTKMPVKPATRVSGAIIAVVNGVPITTFDIELSAGPLPQTVVDKILKDPTLSPAQKRKQIQILITKRQTDIAQFLIDRKLIFQDFQGTRQIVPRAMVEKRLSNAVAERAGGDWGRFERLLRGIGTSLDEYRVSIGEILAVDLRLWHVVKSKIRIQPRAVKEFYETHKSNFVTNGEVSLRIIVLQDDNAKTLQAFNDARKENPDFIGLVKKFSIDERSKQKDGALGSLKINDLNPQFHDALTAYKIGFVSEPFPLNGRTHIIKVIDLTGSNQLSFAQVRPSIQRLLENKEYDRRYAIYTARLRANAVIRLFFDE